MSDRDAEHPRPVDPNHPGLRPPGRSRCRRVSDERLDVVFTATPDVDLVAVSPRPASPNPTARHTRAANPTDSVDSATSSGLSGVSEWDSGDLPGSVRLVDAETAAAIVVLAVTRGVAGLELPAGGRRLSVDEIVAAAEAEVASEDDENDSGS